MGRPPRIQFDGAFYHIFHRGNRRERIFWDEADYAAFEEFMIEAMNWSGVLLYDWSLMPNHFHFLVETPDGNIAEFMQRLVTRYAKYFNWRHKKVGHVFQGRYGSRLCDKEQYFLELVRYVELNPYRLKKGLMAKLGEWKWSSLRYYMGLLSRIRQAFVFVGRSKYRFQNLSLGEYLQRKESTISMMIKRVWEIGGQLSEVKTLLEHLEIKAPAMKANIDL